MLIVRFTLSDGEYYVVSPCLKNDERIKQNSIVQLVDYNVCGFNIVLTLEFQDQGGHEIIVCSEVNFVEDFDRIIGKPQEYDPSPMKKPTKTPPTSRFFELSLNI